MLLVVVKLRGVLALVLLYVDSKYYLRVSKTDQLKQLSAWLPLSKI